ncbi:MAG: 16S rRNA (cytidine(1402)-2'-O)-methyltransferase [Clostridia bacterium]|nr:16S rRNA (cytidine(1402)-2'-O)-methyltransferase [Clostridia bacterium]
MLYFVATPIGNLKDITFRAIETLKEVDVIACEDTRHSITLLNHYDIKKPLISYHKFNEREACQKIVELLNQNKSVAVITDAGMPVISDPGNVLVKTLMENGLEYTVVPGASAFTSALVLSGVNSERFCFIGFLPDKKTQREELLLSFKDTPATLIFYSAPHDVKKDVETLYSVLGNRPAVAVKEITKLHEKVERFKLKDGYPFEPKGEYVLLVEYVKTDENKDLTEKELIEKYIASGVDKKEALKKVAKERGISKSELYKYTIEEGK